jgi:hypothetical protein
VNNYQGVVMHTTGWVLVMLDGWEMHTHWIAVVGFVLLFYSMWSICMKTPEDEAFDEIEKAQGWRKRQIMSLRTNIESFDEWDHSHRPEQYWVERRAYLAGFEAGRRFERTKELND